MKPILSILPLVLAALAVPLASAQAPSGPQFVVQATSHDTIRLSARKFDAGDYRQAAAFARQATAQGLTRSRQSAAWSNLCAARALQGQTEAAMAACETALDIRASWQAHNNYAALLLLADRPNEAQAHLAAALADAPDSAAVTGNLARIASRTLAAAQ